MADVSSLLDSPVCSPVPTRPGRRLSSFHTARRPTRPTLAATPRHPSNNSANVANSTECDPSRGFDLQTPTKLQKPAPARRLSVAPTPGRRQFIAPTALQHHARIADAKTLHGQVPRMSDTELAEMYSTTIKLCQDNKINAKNTWSLNLIDYMSMLVKDAAGADGGPGAASTRADAASADTNFQVAGVTLDAGVRIYCSRVDSVHSNAFKVLGSLSRTSKSKGGAHDDEDNDATGGGVDSDEDGGDNVARGKQRRKRASRAGGTTLEQNMENITTRKLETDLAVDPLFQKMSAAFDEGGAKGMLLNNLSIGPRCEIVFDSSEPAIHTSPSIAGSTDDRQRSGLTYDVTSLLPPALVEDDLALCPRFLAFFRSRMTAAGNDNASSTITALGAESLSSVALGDEQQQEFEFEYEAGDVHAGDSLGTTTVLVSHGPDDDDNAYSGGFEDDDDVAGIFGRSGGRHSTGSMTSTASALTDSRMLLSGGVDLVEAGMTLYRDSEYSFFDTSALQNWAGPEHWRFRAASANAQRTWPGNVNSDDVRPVIPKKPRGKTAMLLDFSAETPDVDFASAFARSKTKTVNQLSVAVQEGFSERKVTLPDDHHFRTETLATLFLKPKVAVVAKRKRPHEIEHPKGSGVVTEFDNTEFDQSARGWYDFDNDGDNDNFCPADDDGGAAFTFEEDSCDGDKYGHRGACGMGLVPEPNRVDKLDIGFATTAKKVDVRQLKSGIWNQLQGGVGDGAGQISSPYVRDDASLSPHESRFSSVASVRNNGSQTLQQLVQSMPTFVPEASLPEVSISYVFLCLLSLANEKSLTMTPASGGALDDLIISSIPANKYPS
jgi:condensin complex subunit 2